ncbi:MAG: Holliday junction resolvase RuvX [Alphaproteobacteria bacterium]|nr:Holliday junction resolvase RuvX [Alphaproteobacteria bacterium]
MTHPTQALPQTVLAFDIGQKRIGVAFGSRMLGQPQPQGTENAQGEARWPHIQRHIQEWQPDALVVGVPFHPDGAEHENTRFARNFARQLRQRFGLPVFEVDERYSTTAALSEGARDADAAAACIILQQYFQQSP